MNDIIHFENVTYRYPGGRDILTDLNFSLARGEMAFITGASGAGKTTLLRLIALLCKPSRGKVTVDQLDLSRLRTPDHAPFRQRIGLVFQNSNLLNDRTIFDNVALPLVIRGFAYPDVQRRVRAALDAVGLLNREKALPLTLSGGEQQRVGIARAIVAKPALILADEPTGNLDPEMAAEIMKLFQRFNQVGVSVLIATHALHLISSLPYRILQLDRGRLQNRPPQNSGIADLPPFPGEPHGR